MKRIIILIPIFLSFFLYNCEKKKVRPKEIPNAAFSADKTVIDVGQTITFTDESENEPTSWAWNFGDDEENYVHSTDQSPSHTYTEAGTYTVILAVANSAGDDILEKTNYITVNPLGYPPVSAFTADKTNIEEGESVQFTDQSTNEPSSWSWSFGDGSTSNQQNPSHTYSSPGTYSVSLTTSNSFGEDTETKNGYITVNEIVNKTDVTFNNMVFTDITITVNGTTKTIETGSSTTFYGLTGESTTIDAYTAGKTTEGTQIGLKISWNNTISLSGGSSSFNLNAASDLFFIYVRNNGTHVLTPLYVNYGLVSETNDNILVPADNVKYRTGYYKAYTNSNARMYYQDTPASYTYWNQGTHFTLPWTTNQSVELLNTHKKSASTTHQTVSVNQNAEMLIPASTLLQKKHDANAIDLISQ